MSNTAENQGAKRILILEDSDIFADVLMEFLSSEPYTLERAINGFEGIKQVYSFKPHLIISDIEMPLFKGYQVTRFLKSRKNTKEIPIIMFSTLGETRDKFWGNHAGADMYIEKSPSNFQPLLDAIREILAVPKDIDFAAIEREGKKINDKSIIEMVNNLLDNKLFQTTVIGMLTELSARASSLGMVARGIFDLFNNICEAEIATIMIRSGKGTLYAYTANYARFSGEIADDFFGICTSDFNGHFPDFQVATQNREDFFALGDNRKKIVSYTSIPLAIGGRKFASVHIGNSINEYFSPAIRESITVFLTAATPIIANALSMFELEELQRNTRTAFARYVPADVMDDIIDESSKNVKQSESRNVTVLFSDIRDFTTISENSDAQHLVEFLNGYFAGVGSEIISEGGHIDKFIGDAIMAVFGAVTHMENPMVGAIRAAVKMLAALKNVDTSKITLPKGKLEIGIGINSGPCVLGNIGFQNKMDYTVIGDTVNLASRIEGITKTYRHPLVVSEYVYNEIKDYFLSRKIDKVCVKGKEKPVDIYAVYTGFKGSDYKARSGEIQDLPVVSEFLVNRDTFVNYNNGLRMLDICEWKTAQEYFSKAVEADETDYLSRLYLQRAIEFSQTPPSA